MNYDIFLDTASQPFLGKFRVSSHLRPVVKDIITIGNDDILYTITRIGGNSLAYHILTENGISIIAENGQFILTEDSDSENVSLAYFVRKTGTSPDSVTMDQSRQSFHKSVFSL